MFDTLLQSIDNCDVEPGIHSVQFCDIYSPGDECDPLKNLPSLAVVNGSTTDMFFMNFSRKYYFEKIDFNSEWNAAQEGFYNQVSLQNACQLFLGFTVLFDLDVPDSYMGNTKKQELCFYLQFPAEGGDDFEKAKHLEILATDILQPYNWTGKYGKFVDPKVYPN